MPKSLELELFRDSDLLRQAILTLPTIRNPENAAKHIRYIRVLCNVIGQRADEYITEKWPPIRIITTNDSQQTV